MTNDNLITLCNTLQDVGRFAYDVGKAYSIDDICFIESPIRDSLCNMLTVIVAEYKPYLNLNDNTVMIIDDDIYEFYDKIIDYWQDVWSKRKDFDIDTFLSIIQKVENDFLEEIETDIYWDENAESNVFPD